MVAAGASPSLMNDRRAAGPGAVAGRARLLLVDDHLILAQGLAVALREEGYDVDIAPGLTAPEILAAAATGPDVVVLDLHVEGEATSLTVIGPVAEVGPRVIVLTAEKDPALLGACLEAGAWAVITKDERLEKIIETIEAAHAGQAAMRQEDRHRLMRAWADRQRESRRSLALFEALTPREEEVLHLLTRGHNVTEIAEVSYVSVATVRSQVRSILQKLGVGSQLQAVVLAVEAGWTPRAAGA